SQSSHQSCSEGSVYDPYQVYDLDGSPRVAAGQQRAERAVEVAGPAPRDVMALRKRASIEMPPAASSDAAASSRDSPTATMLSIRAQNLMAHDQVPLQSLGQLIGSTEYGTNYERLVSNTMKGMRLDVHGLKQIQRSLSNLATSSDSVVRELVAIVRFQGDVIVGIASAVNITRFSF
ncbi:unnamed protein product, partial [Heligmosomoides polygyrus]|uniref:Rep-A_N domain-containing protein n=1 Tax=Heligmosomoides polygyrus TaxID=6339 RepID=A0A183FCM3_HELPZ